MYWRDTEPGRGYYIDVQGNTLFFIAFAYETNGQPSFFAGSGTLQQGFGEVLGFGLPFNPLGYQPWHYTVVDLFRFEGGACLTCAHRPATGAQVGRVELYFDTVHKIYAVFRFTDGTFDERMITRFNYSYTPFATNGPGVPVALPDLRGDWVFVDTLDPSLPAWRYNFTRTEQSVPVINRDTPAPWEVTFFDDTRNARFVCRREIPGLVSTRRTSACQLVVGSDRIFWARLEDDLGLDRIQAGYGAVPTIGEAYRGPGIILGTRVE